MVLAAACSPENVAWETDLLTAFHYRNENGEMKTVMRYQVPLDPDKEAVYIAKHGIAPAERMGFYQNLVRCIQREVSVSEYLNKADVPSVLSYSKVEQEKSEKGTVYIYLETEQVWPATEKLLCDSISASTLLDLIYRLSIILRDISKDGIDVVHRGLDLREVYINAENRVRLSGFFYAACPNFGEYPSYLPGRPVNLPYVLLNGDSGHQGYDIMTLAILSWNLFSGNPYDARLTSNRLVFPEYATEEITDALLCGMSGNPENCNLFRRKLSDCRKQLSKNGEAPVYIPVRRQLLKDFIVEYVNQDNGSCLE